MEYGGEGYGINSDNYKEVFFDTELLIEGISKGRSSVQFCFKDLKKEGEFYYMFLTDVFRMLLKTTIIKGKISGKFGWVKRGQNFGIYFVEETK